MRTLALVVSLGAALSALQLAGAEDPAKLYLEGRKAEHAGQMVRAYLLYSQAAALDPQNQLYWLRSQAVASRAALASPPQLQEPPLAPDTASEKPGTDAFDPVTRKDRAAERQAQPPLRLKASPAHKDFALRADAKSLWQQVARAYALEAVFDGDYQAGPPIRFSVNDLGYRDALHALEASTGSFVIPISSRMFMVAKDTEQKRRELEPTEAVSVPVPHATNVQELTEIAQGVRLLFNLEHIAWDTQENTIVLRDRISRVEPARRVFDELVHHRPQVMVELDLLQLDHSDSLAYGVDLPTSFPWFNLGTFWHTMPSIGSAIANLAYFGGGYTRFGIAIANSAIKATLSQSSARLLMSTSVRALDGLPSTIHVGDRLPVLTSGYFGPPSFSTGGQVYTPPPSFTFEDLGITVKVTPHVNGMEEVTLELETEFKVVSGQSLNGIPIISNRQLNTKLRLRDDEWGVIAGLVSSSDMRSFHGIPILSDIPVLSSIVRSNTKDRDTSQVLLIVKPALLNLPPSEFTTTTIWTGSEQRPVTPL